MLLQNYQRILTPYQRLSKQRKGKRKFNKAKIAAKGEFFRNKLQRQNFVESALHLWKFKFLRCQRV